MDLKNEFDKMGIEEVDLLSENITEKSDASRASRILARVYEKTGVEGKTETAAEASPSSSPKKGRARRAAILRFLLAAAMLALVLALCVAGIIQKTAEPKRLPLISLLNDPEAYSYEMVVYANADPDDPSATEPPKDTSERKLPPEEWHGGYVVADDAAVLYRVSPENLSVAPFQSAYVPVIRANGKTIVLSVRLRILPLNGKTMLTKRCASYRPAAVEIGEGITELGSKVFADCANLAEVKLPSTLVSIADDAFEGCSALKTIVVAPENPVYAVSDGALVEKESGRILFRASA